MSNVDKLKKKAAEFEQKKQFDRALEGHLQMTGQAEGQDDRDVTVYNRVGDLYLRLNKTDQAVNYYEQAVDLYTDGGYLNNAIALCNKILRHAPARHQIYYKLGKISAKKGFNSDAKKNFLEYTDRMHRGGRDGDAFKALQEFADLCPGQDDIRLMLADQLAKAGKTAEAIEQLQILHESLDSEGRTAEAEATVQRIHSLDPNVEPRRSKTPAQRDAGGLVFLDLGGSPPKPRPKVEAPRRTAIAPEPPARPRTPPHVQPSPEFEQLPDIEPTTPETFPALEIQSNSVPGLETGSSVAEVEPAFDLSLNDIDVSPLEGLESAADPSQFAIDPELGGSSSGLEGLISSQPEARTGEPGLGEPLSTEDPLGGLNLLEDNRLFVHEPTAQQSESGSVEAGAPAQAAQRQPVNPFLRQRPKPKQPSPKACPRVATPPSEVPRAATPKENTTQQGAEDNFVDLGDWLREDRPRSTRMVAEEDHNREQGEEADFTDMLEKFKAGVAANVDEEDFDSHYDLGVAYKEMGLIAEAIAEFQKALRGATQRIRAYEALGQCFIERNEHDVAITVLGRALREPGMEDEDLIGVLYLLGFASEGSKKPRDAAAYYQRVFAIDIDFRDVAKRLKQMTKAATK